VPISRPLALTLIILILVAAPPIRAAESQAVAFRREWQGRTVSVQRTLITMVYDERGQIGATYRGKREGLTVTTPTKGYHYLFPGRQSVDDLTDTDPERLVDLVKTRYRRDRNLDSDSIQMVTPLHLIQYVRGIELIVQRVQIERSTVRLELFKTEPADEFATSLTIQWPTPFSGDFHERAELERVIRGFLNPRPSTLNPQPKPAALNP
jgi:hypothetical protein